MLTSETFFVNNIRCEGCVHAIEKELSAMVGIHNVEAEKETGKVTVTGIGLDVAAIKKTLSHIGYPAKEKHNSLFSKTKTAIICAISGK
jgi:copper chaperone